MQKYSLDTYIRPTMKKDSDGDYVLYTDHQSAIAKSIHEWFEKGRDSVMRQNPSGCCCKFSEDGSSILSLCAAHKDMQEVALTESEARCKELKGVEGMLLLCGEQECRDKKTLTEKVRALIDGLIHYRKKFVLSEARCKELEELKGPYSSIQEKIARMEEMTDFAQNRTIEVLADNADLKEKLGVVEEVYKEYVNFLGKANQTPVTMAYAHGWRCPQEDIERGIELREKINQIVREQAGKVEGVK